MLHEHELQHLIRIVLSDPHHIRTSTNGTPLQILSVGEWNHAAGPDFLGMALAAEQRIHVGNGEFHRATSDWNAHKHTQNPLYAGLLLHIVMHNDSKEEYARYTLIIAEDELQAAQKQELYKKELLENPNILQQHIDETQELLRSLALKRLQRKSEYAIGLLQTHTPHQTLVRLGEEFVVQQKMKKRRPRGIAQIQALVAFVEHSSHNVVGELLEKIAMLPSEDGRERLSNILKHRMNTEGKSTRQEYIVNVLLPVCVALCKYSSAFVQYDNVCAWYLNVRAEHSYIALQRRFPARTQDFIYEQQGLLEYLAEMVPPKTSQPAKPSIYPSSAHLEGEFVLFVYGG
jgi:hypothetical protein